jgi:hypothetical protein
MSARTISFGMRPPSGRSKFGNVKTVVAGEKFDSKKEADRWGQLQLLLKAGRIRNLRRQVLYRLEVAGVLICTYKADFVYEELTKGEWLEVVEDSKGYPNERWPMKKRLMLACHGIRVRET